MEGEAGTGKSTLLQKIALDWSSQGQSSRSSWVTVIALGSPGVRVRALSSGTRGREDRDPCFLPP